MRIADLPPHEQEKIREYNRLAKKRSRQKQKAAEILSSDEWFEQFFGSPQYEEVRQYADQQHKQIAQELGMDEKSWHPARNEIDAVLWTVYGFKKNFTREVIDPRGLKVCLLYPDVIGSHIVAATHRHKLESSKTYRDVYRELLQVLDQRFGKQLSEDPIERRAALDIKSELAGTYVLPEHRR
jgi:hypothetical protein